MSLHESPFSAAESWCRGAIAASRKSGDWVSLAKYLAALASLLQKQAGRLNEARELAEAAVGVSRRFDPATCQRWYTYGVLSDILAASAAADPGGQHRAELLAQADQYRQLCDFAQRFLAALAHFGAEASYARAVVQARLARCFYMGGHGPEAVEQLCAARAAVEALAGAAAPSVREGLNAFVGTLHCELGEIFQAMRQYRRAREAFSTALGLAEQLQDVRGQGISLIQLGAIALALDDPAEALARSRTALAVLRPLNEPELEATVLHQLAVVLHRLQQWGEAERHYLEAARIAEQYGYLGQVQQIRQQLDLLERQRGASGRRTRSPECTADAAVVCGHGSAIASSPPGEGEVESEDSAARALQILVDEERMTDYGLDGDLLVEGPRRRRTFRSDGALEDLRRDVCLALAPCVRVIPEAGGSIRFYLPFEEPVFERYGGCMVIERRRRQIRVSGATGILWRMVGAMDGHRSTARVLAEVPIGERANAVRVLSALAVNHALDVSGRSIGRFVHSVTKKGVLPAGGLEGDEVLRLATDGDHHSYPGAPRIALGQDVPERLRAFHTLTRARRSPREFNSESLSRGDFDAILHTACGTSGSLKWGNREVKLRSYPSSGALYAVEVYAIVLRVEGLAPGIYHYRPDESCLEVVKQEIDAGRFLDAMLPTERGMVAGVGAMFCLTGRFARHEKKYGQGGYRMLVAETGHISQNVILTAVALGLSARPFGGVFDALLNRYLGLEDGEEQFLLSVLVGHAVALGAEHVLGAQAPRAPAR